MTSSLMTKTKLAILAAALALTGIAADVTPAQADVMIMPTRIAFKDRDRMKSLTMANTSEERATFRLTFYHQTQQPDGSYRPDKADEVQQYDLSKMMQFSPRQVDLQPRGKQSVRLSVRRPENLPDGEYRTHLKLERLPPPAQKEPLKKGAAVALAINVSFSIPVMLRKGVYDAKAKISNFRYIPSPDGNKPAKVNFTLDRTGKYSTLGNIKIYWTPPGGKERQVGIRNGVNVFPEVSQRKLDIDLTEKGISGGKMRVVYDGADADQGILFDEKSFPVGG